MRKRSGGRSAAYTLTWGLWQLKHSSFPALAWKMDSTAGYHGIMMLFLMPMLLLSGAFFPMADAHWLLSWIRHVNPMTYGVGGLRHALQGEAPGCPPFTVCLVGFVSFTVWILVAYYAVGLQFDTYQEKNLPGLTAALFLLKERIPGHTTKYRCFVFPPLPFLGGAKMAVVGADAPRAK